ncbi:hypothetical protein QOZ80_5AG0408440 [Eleusine coracana subsp. coracana]|nr:hypothetical protein QOZ80_5AG0408440 [Eleusine coracana subsp. coracana]
MDGSKKAYVVAIIIQLIYTGLYVISKAAFNHGMNTYVFIFYRQAAATVLLLPLAIILERRNAPPMSLRLFMKLFVYALLGSTVSMNLYNIGLKYTSATVSSATSNSIPVATFFLAVLLRLEVVRLRSPSGMAKAAGVALCLAGVLTIALYTGPSMSPVNHHRVFADHQHHAETRSSSSSKGTWIKGTFLMLLANITWSLWIVLQASLLKEYPSKLMSTLMQCLLSTVQSFVLAMAMERDLAAWKLRLDVGLLAVAYSGLVVTGVSFYLQAWCIEKRGPVFLAMSNPLGLLFTIFCSSFFLGEVVHLGSILGGALLVGGLYSVLWGKSKDHQHHQPPPLSAQENKQTVVATIISINDDEEKQQKQQKEEEASSSPLQQHQQV